LDQTEDPENWNTFAKEWLAEHELPARRAMLVAGPSPRNPRANYRIEIMQLEP
jgi:pyruvate kinase